MKRASSSPALVLIMCLLGLIFGIISIKGIERKAEVAPPAEGYSESASYTNPPSVQMVPSPVSTFEWHAKLLSPYGTGQINEGVGGLEFFYDARKPINVLQNARTYIGNVITGTIMPTSDPAPTYPYTWTAVLDDTDLAQLLDRFTITSSCPITTFGGMRLNDFVSVQGTITSLNCGQVASGTPCRFDVRADRIAGQNCP